MTRTDGSGLTARVRPANSTAEIARMFPRIGSGPRAVGSRSAHGGGLGVPGRRPGVRDGVRGFATVSQDGWPCLEGGPRVALVRGCGAWLWCVGLWCVALVRGCGAWLWCVGLAFASVVLAFASVGLAFAVVSVWRTPALVVNASPRGPATLSAGPRGKVDPASGGVVATGRAGGRGIRGVRVGLWVALMCGAGVSSGCAGVLVGGAGVRCRLGVGNASPRGERQPREAGCRERRPLW